MSDPGALASVCCECGARPGEPCTRIGSGKPRRALHVLRGTAFSPGTFVGIVAAREAQLRALCGRAAAALVERKVIAGYLRVVCRVCGSYVTPPDMLPSRLHGKDCLVAALLDAEEGR